MIGHLIHVFPHACMHTTSIKTALSMPPTLAQGPVIAFVDNPHQMEASLLKIIPSLGEGLPPGHVGVKGDAGHLMFSSLGRKLNSRSDKYSECA